MTNIRIEVKGHDYIVVIADTKRFGKNEVMFEGNTFNQCFDFIKRETGMKEIPLVTRIVYGTYTDREARTFPFYMRVDN